MFICHAGDNKTWGNALMQAFAPAVHRVGMTGTPWRRPRAGRIPFVSYEDTKDGKGRDTEKVRVDFAYEYGAAVRDLVCRGVQFHAYDGEVKYVDVDSCSSREIIVRLGEEEDSNSAVLRDLLNPDHPWLRSMLKRGNDTLTEIRQGTSEEGAVPDAKGLVIVDGQRQARQVAKLLQEITRESPELIISDEKDAKEALDRFRNGRGRWAVAVDMFSEGVDVPALFVGIYATRKKTPLRFRQIVGRFVRRRGPQEERDAVIFMPAVPELMQLSSEIETELRHLVEEDRIPREPDVDQDALGLDSDVDDTSPELVPVGTSDGQLVQIMRSGKSYTEVEYLDALAACQRHGIPNMFAINMIEALREASPRAPGSPASDVAEPSGEEIGPHRLKKLLRKEIDRAIGKKAYALGTEKKDLNSSLFARFGARERMSIEQLRTMLSYVQGLGGEASEPA